MPGARFDTVVVCPFDRVESGSVSVVAPFLAANVNSLSGSVGSGSGTVTFFTTSVALAVLVNVQTTSSPGAMPTEAVWVARPSAASYASPFFVHCRSVRSHPAGTGVSVTV